MHDLYDLIIVGGGPGGIAAAVEGTVHKVGKILLIEKGENHSQTIRLYYKDYKRVDKDWQGTKIDITGNIEFFDGTKESTLDYFDELLDHEDIDSLFNCNVDHIKKTNDIFEVVTNDKSYKGKNVVVAIGRMGKPNKPSYKMPRSIKSHISFSPYDCKGEEKILVVGGGDSAVEYACELSTHNNVTLSYRRDSFGRANDINKEMIERYDNEERLRVRFLTNIESLDNEEGRVKANYEGGFHVVYDRVLYALGGTTPTDFLRKSDIKLDDNDEAKYDDKTYETSVKGLYLAGDIITDGGGTIAAALNHAYDSVKDMTGK